jgi:putative DNA primase/helicase
LRFHDLEDYITVSGSVNELPPDRWQRAWIAFRGLTPGDEQVADAYHAVGTLEGWVRAVRPLAEYPRVLLALYTSFVPPLLMILQAPNFMVDWAHRASTGKTTGLRVASGVWGRPDERAPDGALATWDATRVWVERASSMLSGLPLILDDTKRAKDPRLIADLLCTVASGRGRGRGNPKSLAPTRSWRTVLLSTGEAPATSFTQDGGTRMRCLEVRGLPFGRQDEETRGLIDRLNVDLQTHYGHAGPTFVRWLLQRRRDWVRWVKQYRQTVEAYAERAKGPEAGRLAQYAAAIELAAALVHHALDLPWSYNDPLDALWTDIAAEAD